MDPLPTVTAKGGLTVAEVADRVARGQVNRVRSSLLANYADILRRNLLTVFNALVVPAATALIVLGDYRAGISVSGMMVINTVLGLAQEIRAKRHLDRLALLAEAKTHVRRGGQVQEIQASDIVLGDHIILQGGDAVLADGTLLEARYLEIDEALLTGESDPVPRRDGDEILSGSIVVAGEGVYRADHVGPEAFAQRITTQARSYHYVASPLQKALDRIIVVLTCLAVVLSGFYVLLYCRGQTSQVEMFRRIAATITSTVPQGLVLMATLACLLGAVRMGRRGAVVQRLNAVESMAAVDVLCMDKTGTLSTNRLKLERLIVLDPGESREAVERRLRWFASASLDRASKSLLALREALGEETVALLDQVPFKSQNRYSAVRVSTGSVEYGLALGAFEALQPFVNASTADRFPEEGRRQVEANLSTAALESAWRELMQTGFRLLLFAEVETKGTADRTNFDGSLTGFRLRPLALLAFSDELRPSAREVLELLAGQGIDFKVISGDNPETVRATMVALAGQSSLPSMRALTATPVVTGTELVLSGDPTALIGAGKVFGRITPAQKLQIVDTLQRQGRFVAMIGDGVNDVLPIKHAHLGIAMGDGSRATKSVSALVLETNDFGVLPQTLAEGRNIIRNLRRTSKLFLVKNLYTLVLVVGALGFLGLPFPFLPQQVTLLNLLTIGVPAFLITLSRERCTAPSPPGFLREVGLFVLRTGLVIGLSGLTILYLSNRVWKDNEATQRSLLLSTLIFHGLTTLLRALRDGEYGLTGDNRRFRWLAAGAVPLYLLAMYWPPSGWYHELTPLGLTQWAWLLGIVGASYGLLCALDRVF